MTNKDYKYIALILGITGISIFGGWTLTEDHRFREEQYIAEIRDLREKSIPPPPKIEIILPDFSNLEGTVGFENNNPCNIKKRYQGAWWGQKGVDRQGHVIFEHYSYSLRAAAKVLMAYQTKHKRKTLRQIFTRYIWATGNPKKEYEAHVYAKFVAKRLHVGVDQEIDVKQYMPELLKSIVLYENGKQPYPDSAFVLAGMFGDYE